VFETFVGSTINAKAKKIVFCFLLSLLFFLGYHSAIITINKSDTSKLSNDNIPYRRNLIRRMNNSLHLQYLCQKSRLWPNCFKSRTVWQIFSVYACLIECWSRPRFHLVWVRFGRDFVDAIRFRPPYGFSRENIVLTVSTDLYVGEGLCYPQWPFRFKIFLIRTDIR
jgi:hypothetical protein